MPVEVEQLTSKIFLVLVSFSNLNFLNVSLEIQTTRLKVQSKVF